MTPVNVRNLPTQKQALNILSLLCVRGAGVEDHSPGNIDNLTRALEPWIYRVPTPRGKFKSRIRGELIDFPNLDAAMRYQKAYEIYLAKMEKLHRERPTNAQIEELVALGQFLQAAEKERGPILADRAYASVTNDNQAVGVGFNYKATAVKAIKHLMLHYGVRREQISVIWGGDDALEAKNRLNPMQIFEALQANMTGKEVSRKVMRIVERQLAESSEDRAEAELLKGYEFKFGSQTQQARQEEIARFQTGKSLYCFFSRAAGGVGLSLHHADKDNRGRPVTLRQRRGYMCPCWSAQDIVQLLGRLHRTIFSLSDTTQDILWFRGTMEEHVMKRVSVKLKALSRIVKQREDWHDAILEASKTETQRTWDAELREAGGDSEVDGSDMVASDDEEGEEEES